MMNTSLLAQHYLSTVSFKSYSSQDLKRLSVLEVTNPTTFDALGHPATGGLHDPALGPSRRDDICTTCSLGASGRDECPGHFGHINLPLPVFNPFFIRQTYQILSMCCFNCHHLLFQPAHLQIVLAQITALDHGLDYLVDEIQAVANDLLGKVKGAVDPDFVCYLSNRLKECIESALKVNGASAGKTGDSHQVKNIIDRKQRLLKALLQGKLIKIARSCPHCINKKWSMALVNNSMVLMNQPRAPVKHIGGPSETRGEADDETVLKDKVPEVDVNIGGKSYLTPLVARDHLRKLFSNETQTLKLMLKLLKVEGEDESTIDTLFMDTVPVTPPRFRPLHYMSGKSYEDEATTLLNQVLIAADNLKNALKDLQNLKTTESASTSSKEKSLEMAKLHNAWNRLQILCNRIYDSEMDKLPEKKYPGVRQVLEKKEGLFRKNMMGKRVNYAARSVISPDPYISVDEIGIPEIFATRLSYPQPVTPWNIEQMKQAVLNGPDVHPGALSVAFDDGSVIRLKATDPEQRARLSSILGQQRPGSRIVNRHLVNGDVLLLNRQPTLHKPSIMAHKARVLKREKTLRLHYSNCKCYNADFDGDEMNAHFPQSELARAEAYNIVSVNKQYLVPKDGSPLGGLIQDHIVSSTILTMKGNFFSQQDYQQLVFSGLFSLNRPIKFVKPAMWRPVPLWSGKQVITTLILNIVPENKQPPTLYIPAKVSSKVLTQTNPRSLTTTHFFTPPSPEEMSDANVVIRNGEVMKGLIDKANIGPTTYGLIHCCYEFYGGEVSNALLTAVARLCTVYLQIHGGITLGIEDILVTKEADAVRKKIIKKSTTVGDEVAAKALGLGEGCDKETLTKKLREWHASQDPALMKTLDSCMKAQTDEVNNGITKACLPAGLIKQFPHNNLQLMIQSGAKGGTVNALQISCLLGQIELEGRRVPLMMSGRTLPSFLPYDTSPKAGGFVTGRFLTGIRPQEFFFHCMAGREGLIDTAVKTSRSGYLQRCLIKHLEGLTVHYDSTIRDSDGSLVQLQYGEDGIDIMKSQLLKPNAMPLLIHNRSVLMPDKKELTKMNAATQRRKINEVKQAIEDWEAMNGKDRLVRRQGSGFQEYFEVKLRDYQETTGKTEFAQEDYTAIIDTWFELTQADKKKLNFYFLPCPGPLSSDFRPNSNFGIVPEKMEYQIQHYLENSKDSLVKDENDVGDESWKGKRVITVKDLKKLIHSRFMKSLCDPGEAVGLLAAQSIGEPSTQMTLNTFHFAGRGDMNVTLGIPRLREILMTASPRIATPNMDIPFLPDLGPNIERKAERIRRKLNAVKLSDVLETIDVTENLSIDESCSRYYDITFKFLPYSTYKKRLNVKPQTILNFMESKFIKNMVDAIKKATIIQRKYNSLYDHSTHHRDTKGGQAESGEGEDEPARATRAENVDAISSDEEDNAVEEDTHAAQTKAHRNQELDYEEPEEDEVEANKEPDEEEAEKVITVEDEEENRPKDDDDDDLATTQENETLSKALAEQKRHAELQAERAGRESFVKEKDNFIDLYDYDTAKREWCRVVLKFPLREDKIDVASVVEEEARKAYVHKVGTIDRAFLVDDREATKRGCSFGKMIKTEGVCFLNLVNYHRIFDLNRVYSNDIHAIANTYGIEAARKAITIEIANVFSVYGIEVDPRHLSLIADYMTFDGTIKGMNRISMAGSSSPLQQMTFETTAAFLKSALLLGFKDEFKSPSARIFAGRPPICGTGICGLVQDGTVEYKATKTKRFGSKYGSTKSPNKSLSWSPNKPDRKRRYQSPNVDKNKPLNKRIKFV